MSIDFEGTMNRLGDDLSLFQEFIGFYEEDCPRLMENLSAAVSSGNADALHHAAHSLKGLVTSIGATDVADQATALERMGRAGDLTEAKATLAKLQAAIKQLRVDLGPYRKQEAHSRR